MEDYIMTNQNPMNRNTPKEVAKKLVRYALSELNDMLNANKIGKQLIQKIKIEQASQITMSLEHQFDWSIVILLTSIYFEEKTVFKEFKQVIEQDNLLGSRMNTLIGTSRQRRRMICSDFFQILLKEIINKCHNKLEISDNQFDIVWNYIVQLLLADKIKTKFWCILENINMSTDLIQIVPNIYMRGLSIQEIEQLWNNNKFIQDYYPFYGYSFSSILDVRTLLETTVEETVIIGEEKIDKIEKINPFESVRSSFESICTSIRLLHSEPVKISPIITEVGDVWGTTSVCGSLEKNTNLFKRCILSNADIEEIQKLLKVINTRNNDLSGTMKVCLQRINFANTRFSSEDRLLDIMIALEALVLYDSGDPKNRGELSFRLAIRLSKYLGADKENQMQIFNLVRNAYKLRSKVVHGDQLTKDEDKIIGEIENITKNAIRKYIDEVSNNKM